MASESWAVNIPGEQRFSNLNLTTGAVNNTQLTLVSGARFASKNRTGNWDRPRPVFLSPSPYDLNNYVVRMPRGRSVMDYPSQNLRQVWEGALQISNPPASWLPVSVIDQLRNEALIDALVRLKDQKFNAGVALAEASGVAHMAMDAMHGISRVRRDFLKGDLRSAYNRFRREFKSGVTWSQFKKDWNSANHRTKMGGKLPNSWLYYHFGIKPTMDDIDNAHVDWFRRNATPGQNSTFRGTVRGSAKHAARRVDQWNTSHYIIATDMWMEDVQSMRVYLHVTAKDEFLARLAQLGASNYPEAAWNGLIFSWMVDYFVSIGDWLSVLDAGMGYEFGSTVESYRRITRFTARRFKTNHSGPSSVLATPYSSRRTVLNRRVVVELYPPMYRVIPKLKLKDVSLTKYANLLSVLSGLFSGGTPNVRI